MAIYLTKAECFKEVGKNYMAKLGYILQNCPFIVPITYYFDEAEACILAYSVHGHKIEGMRKNTTVCLYIDNIVSVTNWKSILIHGSFEELNKLDRGFYLDRLGNGVRTLSKDKEFKGTRALDAFSNVKFLKGDPVVYRINIWEMTGRKRNE